MLFDQRGCGATSASTVGWCSVGRVIPEQWACFRDGIPPSERDGSLVEAYSRLLADHHPAVRETAARDWCAWEDVHVSIRPDHQPDPRYEDPAFRMTFARLVTHYWRHAAWLEDGALLRDAIKLRGTPGALVHGRLDVSGPPDIAWKLAQIWPDAELTLVSDAAHGSGNAGRDRGARSGHGRLRREPLTLLSPLGQDGL